MRILFGFFLVIAGIILGAYVGVYLMLFQGIVALINCVQHPELATATQWAWAIIRIFPLAELFGWLSAFVFIVTGFGMLLSRD